MASNMQRTGSMASIHSPVVTTPAPTIIVLRINVPSLKLQKALKVNTSDTVWSLKKQLMEKFGSDVKDIWNFGLYLHGKEGRQGKFLDERKDLSIYGIDANSQLDFTHKFRLNAEPDIKKQKKLFEDIQKGAVDKAREKITKTTETNFLSDTQESLLATAVMNNDRDAIALLVENGAFLDFRNGDKDGWKTPLHMAAYHNKPVALKALLEFGAWPNAVDVIGLPPIYYAATSGYTECVLRLLIAKADTEVFDESGKGPLHQAALNNFDCIVALLIDFGANIHATNVAGNTPLHVAAMRNAKESTKWLLLRGAERDRLNKTGKTPMEAATQANCPETAEMIQKFTDDHIADSNTSSTDLVRITTTVPPPPKGGMEGDVTAIVSNVLASLAGSIGGEYKPQIYIGKNRASTISSSPGGTLPRKGNSMLDVDPPSDLGRKSESSRKSMVRKSINPLPPPPKRMSGMSISTYGSDGSKTNSTFYTTSEASAIRVALNDTCVSSPIDGQHGKFGGTSLPAQMEIAEPRESAIRRETGNGMNEMLSVGMVNPNISRSGIDLSASVFSLLKDPLNSSTNSVDFKWQKESDDTESSRLTEKPAKQIAMTASPTIVLPESFTSPEVLQALKKLFGNDGINEQSGAVDPRVISSGIEQLEDTMTQTLKALRQLEAENQRLRDELGKQMMA